MKTTHYSPSQQLTYLLPTPEQVDAHAMEFGGGKICGLGKAMRKLIKDIIHNPDNPELWIDLGYAFGFKADLALTFYYTAFRIAPFRSKYIHLVACTLSRMGDMDGAMKFMDDALGNSEQGTDEYALLQCFKEQISLTHKIHLIKERLGIDW